MEEPKNGMGWSMVPFSSFLTDREPALLFRMWVSFPSKIISLSVETLLSLFLWSHIRVEPKKKGTHRSNSGFCPRWSCSCWYHRCVIRTGQCPQIHWYRSINIRGWKMKDVDSFLKKDGLDWIVWSLSHPSMMGNSFFSCLDRGLVNGIFKLAFKYYFRWYASLSSLLGCESGAKEVGLPCLESFPGYWVCDLIVSICFHLEMLFHDCMYTSSRA